MFAVSVLVAVLELQPVLIAAKVAENESLYRDIDVTYQSEYRLARLAQGQLIQDELRTVHVVRQKAMHRIAITTRAATAKLATTRVDVAAYDGEATLIRKGNLTEKFMGARPMWSEAYFPHLWAIAPLWDNFPLSAAIAGGKVWEKATAGDSTYKGCTLAARVANETATVAGEPCVVVRTELTRPPRGRVSSVRVYWLATRKNYLPIKTEKFAVGYSGTLPIEVVECGDFRELRKGVWLPHRVTRTVFDELELRDGKQVVSNVTTTTVSDPKLGPTYDRAFFREVQLAQ